MHVQRLSLIEVRGSCASRRGDPYARVLHLALRTFSLDLTCPCLRCSGLITHTCIHARTLRSTPVDHGHGRALSSDLVSFLSRLPRRLSSLCVRAITTTLAAFTLGGSLAKWQYRGGGSADAKPKLLTPGDEGEIVGFRISSPAKAETSIEDEEDAKAHQACSLSEVSFHTAGDTELVPAL